MARNTESVQPARSKGTREPGFNRKPRASRASQSRENAADPRKRPVILSSRPLNLPDVKARPGMVQRYVRVAVGNNDDADNVSRAEALGWTPRKASTLPSGQKAPTIKKGEYAGYIGTRGNVLMERPKELNDAYKQANLGSAGKQMEAVERQLSNEHRPGTKGLGRPKMARKTEVGVRRREALVQEDSDGGDAGADDVAVSDEDGDA